MSLCVFIWKPVGGPKKTPTILQFLSLFILFLYSWFNFDRSYLSNKVPIIFLDFHWLQWRVYILFLLDVIVYRYLLGLFDLWCCITPTFLGLFFILNGLLKEENRVQWNHPLLLYKDVFEILCLVLFYEIWSTNAWCLCFHNCFIFLMNGSFY